MSRNDVDETMAVLAAVGIAWGLNQIRTYAHRLWAVLAFLFLVLVTSLLIWFSVDLWHYMLTTPACERNGTCLVTTSTSLPGLTR